MAWRQLRGAVLSTAALTGLVVTVLVVLGAMSRSVAGRLTAACTANDAVTCAGLQEQLAVLFDGVARYLSYLPLSGVLIAAIWGAPMISREIESGTAALAWHQSVTRRHWFTVRLALSLAVLTPLGLILGFAVTWWAASFGALAEAAWRIERLPSSYGPMMPALWITGLSTGVLVGSMIRRTLPAAAVTAVVTFVGLIMFNIFGGLPDGDPSSNLQILAFQVERAVLLLVLAAITGALSFRQLASVRV